MPSLFAQLVLLAWLPIGVMLFRAYRPATAATIVLLGANVLLPANIGFDFPGFPTIDRHVVGAIAALAGYYLVAPARRRRRQFGWLETLIAINVVAVFFSIHTNPDPLPYGSITLPGLRMYDGLAAVFERVMTIGVPCFLGLRIVRSMADVQAVLRVVVVFGIIYAPLVLWESRMSPQLHYYLYGFFPHSFLQHVREGGFRPLVFTSHGLETALFMATATIAALTLALARRRVLGVPAVWLFVVLLLGLASCRSLGSLLYGILVAAVMLLGRTLQARIVLGLSFVVMFYPFLRSQEMFPTATLVGAAQYISPHRADSLDYRFKNEDLLLAKARQRLWFGWGTWGRHHVYESGRTVSTTDGYWILEIGKFGLIGFLSFFVLILTPVVKAARKFAFLQRGPESALVVGMTMLVLVRAIDLVPNAFPAPFTFFMLGVLACAITMPVLAIPGRTRTRPAIAHTSA